MAGRLPTELYVHPRPGDVDVVERVCVQATARPAQDVVAVAVAPTNVAQASELLFGTGIGVVSMIDDTSPDLIDQARRSVAEGATEIALPPMVLDQGAMLMRLRSRLGPGTPVTVDLADACQGVDLAAAGHALQLGADYIAFSPRAGSATARRDIANLLALAYDLQLGGVKVTMADVSHAAWLQAEPLAPTTARLRMAHSPATG